MPLRFSKEGPAFPSQLVDALLVGEVVFLCGAGVSAPQLPDFGGLVKSCFADLNVQMNPSEQHAFGNDRYEEVLGSLSRRIVDPTHMIRTVVKLLQPPMDLNLDNHHTILRLSRNIENKPTIVTTNFDTLIERALLEKAEPEGIRSLSSAGQDLPPPGSSDFGGIIHLHGRIADEDLDLEETALVVTSADYGDAYMRSGWASRFLFDLCRSKTIVLVGYSAGDAPFRYFLNVLEADRQRFPDLRPVYALDAVDDRDGHDVRWSTLAVEPIPYEYVPDPATGRNSHSAMWRDLGKLADVVERPRSTRRTWAQEILVKSHDRVSQEELDRVKWLFADHRDLWSIATTAIVDPEWFHFFVQHELWTDRDAAWVVAAWIARDFQSADRFNLAVSLRARLRTPFADELDRRLGQAMDIPALWMRAWRLLSKSLLESMLDTDMRMYSVEQRLRASLVLNLDIQEAVELLTPTLKIEPNRSHLYGESIPDPPSKLSDLAWLSFAIQDRDGAAELVDSLVEVSKPNMIIRMATAKLHAVIQQAIDAECIAEDYDSIGSSVPSIEPHEQNEHRDGPIFLIELIARLIKTATTDDREAVRSLAESWRQLPGILGLRLWLHSLREPKLYSSDDAMVGLEALSLSIFWSLKREIALLLLSRARDADRNLVMKIERRILSEGGKFYERFQVEEGQVDWREHARDSAVWLRLEMLRQAEAISDAGRAELTAIKERRDYLERDVEDRDFFSSYSHGVRSVVGDAQPIIEAEDEQRLEVAHQAIRSQDIDKQEGWWAYCHTDPRGAFDTLSKAPLDEVNALLWRDFVNSLASTKKNLDTTTRDLIIETFRILGTASDDFLAAIIRQLVDLFTKAPREELPDTEGWWSRLFAIAVAHDNEPINGDRNLYNAAINLPGGKLTEAALIDIETVRKSSAGVPPGFVAAITTAATASGRQGTMARATLIRHISFVMSIEGQNVVSALNKALSGDTPEAVGLRAVLVGHGHISPKAHKTFSNAIKLGLKDLDGNRSDAIAAAANLLSPALSLIRNESSPEDWGLSLDDVADILRSGSSGLRVGASDVLRQWVVKIEGGPEQAWRNAIGPLLERVWPRERTLRKSGLTRHFTELAVNSGEAFPEAFEQLRPYLMRLEQTGGVFPIKRSKAPEDFPHETLGLLWCLFGPGHVGNLSGVPEILERLIKADPKIELDRRLQWLDQNATHYD
ncbi:SIR2 family protein [Anderseniella sp. Alg231-50]|uniref:SIR2 family protein n=1 Tax=Anderseniella sp. Alg231-50 TaxID=1922226 RepID=UPI00307C6514